jgi:hypothetical protein
MAITIKQEPYPRKGSQAIAYTQPQQDPEGIPALDLSRTEELVPDAIVHEKKQHACEQSDYDCHSSLQIQQKSG